MRAATAVCLLLLLLAGCGAPSDPAPAPATTAPSPVDQDYDLTVRVSEERPDGPSMKGVEVQAFVLDEAGRPGPTIPRSTDTQGFARFTFEDPARVAVRATAPGWTREGVILNVGDRLTADDPTVVLSERDLFLPLYHGELRLSAATSLMTSTVEPQLDGSVEAPVAAADLAFPDGLAGAYLSRLSAADVRVRWEDTASSRADLAAALAWDGQAWAQGDASGPGLLPGPREATYSGKLPADGRPDDLTVAHLQAAAVLASAAVGDVPLAFEVRLSFAGLEPPGLPVACHAMATSTTACLPALPPLPPA